MKEALYYEKLDENEVMCVLCPNNCVIPDGAAGICGVRKNNNGILEALTYNMVSSLALDPIEKKPLDYFMPGSYILSAGTFGCNFKCGFCQNWTISQERPELETITPEALCETAESLKDNIGIAFTYNEPFIWYEYVLDACRINRANKKVNVLVTNGFINREPLEELLPYIDAMNIDLKSFSDEYYMSVCRGKLEPVMETIKTCAPKCHVELTNLSVPGMNDSVDEMDKMSIWIASVDKDIPLHLIPFRPLYKMKNLPGQDFNKLHQLRDVALKHLTHVLI